MSTCCCGEPTTETRATCQCHASLEERSCLSGNDERPSEEGSFGKAINDLIVVNLTIFQLQTREMTEESALTIKGLCLRRRDLIQHLNHLYQNQPYPSQPYQNSPCPTAPTTAQCCEG